MKNLAGMLKLVWTCGALGLVLALAMMLNPSQGVYEAAAQTTQTIILNTGYDQWAATPVLIPVGGADNEWRVMADPTSTLPPSSLATGRPANVVSDVNWYPNYSGSSPNYPKSAWISINSGANPGSQTPPTLFKYSFYFTLPPGFSSPQLTMKLNADDHITNVTLNNCSLFAGTGGIFNASPLAVSSSQTSCFKSGSNVNILTVTVEDTAGGVTGLIVDGTVTYEDCDRKPIKDIPGLTSITFWESTFVNATSYMVLLNSPGMELQKQLSNPLSSTPANRDFEGAQGEYYDVFISDWNGTPNASTGQFITIEAVWNVGAPSGGGLNIARVDFNGTGQFANSVASFVALGNNAMPNDVVFAVDGYLQTDTTMGNTNFPPANQRLRVTVGFPCSCVQAPSGMVAWWPLDDTSGTTVTDIAAPPFGVLPLNNGVSKPGAIGPSGPDSVQGNLTLLDKALYFILPSNYVEVPPSPDLNLANSSLTIDAWVMQSRRPSPSSWFASSTKTFWFPVVDKLDIVSKTGYGFFVQVDANCPACPPPSASQPATSTVEIRLLFVLGDGTVLFSYLSAPVYTGTGTITPPPTQSSLLAPPGPGWMHVTVRVDQGSKTLDFYYQGNLVPNAPSNPSLVVGTNNVSPLRIGGSLFHPFFTEFTLNEIELFNVPLSPLDIKAIATVGKCKSTPTPDPTSDLGDAPDSTNNFNNAPMTAYPSIQANFPTVFNSSPPGPKHLQPKTVAWLGADVSIENEADIFPPDQDGLSNIDPPNNIPDRDGKDDGLVKPASLPACGQIQLNYTLATLSNTPLTQNMYVNVWLDYNRDGDWADSFKCPLGPSTTGLASEWAVQNELLPAGGSPGSKLTPLFTAANLDPGKDIWVRITLSDQPAQVPSAGGNPDGQGPPSGFKYGETEDHLWEKVGLPPTETKCDLKIEKKVQPNPLVNGQPATVTITVTNVGDAPCPGPTTVTETVPSGLTLVSAGGSGWFCVGPVCTYPLPIPVNGSVSVNYNFNVTAPAGTAVQNCASVSNPNDPNAANDRDCVTTPVVPGRTACDLKITKTVSPNPVQTGQQVTFTLNVQNVGNGPCQGITTVTDGPLPWLQVSSAAQGGSQWNCSVAPPNPGATVSCTWNASIQPVPPGPLPTISITGTVTALSGSQIQNCATVSNPNDTNPANNQSCATIQVASGFCDLKITKTVSPNPVQSGGQITVTLTVQNIGTASCGPMPGGILVADPNTSGLVFTVAPVPNQPVWTCGLTGPGSGIFCSAPGLVMPPNYSVTFTITNVNVTAAAGSTLQNCAVVTNTGGNTNPSNDQSCVTIQVIGGACDLKITKTASPNPVQTGQQLTITLTVTNVGTGACAPGAFPGTGVRDNKPSGLTFNLPVAVSQPNWQCSLEVPSGNLTCATQQNTLQPNASVTFSFKATAGLPMGGTVQNCATVSNSNDTNAANNQSCVNIQISPPSLSLAFASLRCTLALVSPAEQDPSCLYETYLLRRKS